MSAPKARKSASAITSPRSRLPAAFKHGVFAAIELLPWEDPAAYEQLRQDLFKELDPEGALQIECARDIFVATWRKQRLRERRIVEAQVTLLEPQNRVFDLRPDPLFETDLEQMTFLVNKPSSERISAPRDDCERLLQFSSSLRLDLPPVIVEISVSCLPKEYKEHLQAQVPQEKFETTHHWIGALKKEVDGVLLPEVRKRRPDAKGYLPAAAALLAPEKMLEDLAIEERLDAQIDRALRRLNWLKIQKKLDREAKQKLIHAKSS